MKTLLTTSLIFVLLSLAAHAYALPDCTGERETWDDCFGSIIYPDGSKYDGEFKDNKFHGKGTFALANGREIKGIWADNKYIYESAEHRRREENNARTECAKEAGKANTEYAAKKIEEACLEQKGYGKAWYEW